MIAIVTRGAAAPGNGPGISPPGTLVFRGKPASLSPDWPESPAGPSKGSFPMERLAHTNTEHALVIGLSDEIIMDVVADLKLEAERLQELDEQTPVERFVIHDENAIARLPRL